MWVTFLIYLSIRDSPCSIYLSICTCVIFLSYLSIYLSIYPNTDSSKIARTSIAFLTLTLKLIKHLKKATVIMNINNVCTKILGSIFFLKISNKESGKNKHQMILNFGSFELFFYFCCVFIKTIRPLSPPAFLACLLCCRRG